MNKKTCNLNAPRLFWVHSTRTITDFSQNLPQTELCKALAHKNKQKIIET